MLPWPNAAHDAGRAGRTVVTGPDDPTVLSAPWPYQAAGVVGGEPAIGADGVAFVAADDGTLAAVGSDASVLWTRRLPGRLASTPSLTYGGDRRWVTVGDGSGELAVLDAETGTIGWTARVPAGVSVPVIARLRGPALHTVFAQDDDGGVHGRDQTAPGNPASGWSTAPGTADGLVIALSEGGVVMPDQHKYELVYAIRGATVVCLDRATGAELGVSPSLGMRVTTLTPVEDAVLAGGDGALTSLSPDCAGVLWSESVGAAVTGVARGPGRGLAVVAGSRVMAYEHTGSPGQWSQRWTQTLKAVPAIGSGVTVDAAGTIVVPVAQSVTAYRWPTAPNGNQLAWSVRLGGPVAAPAVDGAGRLYVPQGSRVEVVDEKPAFKLAYADSARLHTLREVYGVVDPARTVALAGAGGESEPSFPRNPGALAWSTPPGPAATAGNDAGHRVTGNPAPGVSQHDAALSPLHDITGQSLLPDRKSYLGYTDTPSAVRFRLLPGAASVDAAQFAVAQGIAAADAASLTGPSLRTAHPAFAPDGTKAAWTECPAFGAGSIVVLQLATRQVVRRTVSPSERLSCAERAPVFSPDSRWLAVESGNGITGLELGGPGTFAVAPFGVPGASYRQPTWSPDGTRIAVTLVSGGQTSILSLAGPGFGGAANALVQQAGHPSYHLSKLPAPIVRQLGGGPAGKPDGQRPGEVIDVYGQGFDLVRPQGNHVYFTHTQRHRPLLGQVVGGRVDPTTGLGVLSVRVPDLAGNGPLTVVTGAGRSAVPFTVLPTPLEARNRRSVPGHRIRVFGRGFDLSPATSTRVVFRAPDGKELFGTVTGGGVEGDREFLTVTVPDGVADTAQPLRTESNVIGATGVGFDCGDEPCRFTRLRPVVTLTRDDATLPAQRWQVTGGMTLRMTASDLPADPYFGTGKGLELLVMPQDKPGGTDWRLPFRTGAATVPVLPLPATTGDTVAATATAVFNRGPSPAWDRWGDLDVWFSDPSLPARPNGQLRPIARAYLQSPRLNIPVVFVSGTSGSPLTLNGPAFTAAYPGEVQSFPGFCWNCVLAASGGPIPVNPGPNDTRGPRVWLGPDFLDPAPGIESLLALCSQMSACQLALGPVLSTLCAATGIVCVAPPLPHQAVSPRIGYSDALAFTAAGTPVNPQIGPSAADAVFRAITLHPALASLLGYPNEPVYEDLLAFLTGATGPGNSVVPVDSLGRPLIDARGLARPRALGSGADGLYVFPYDWRTAMPAQATALNTFISSVLARPDVSSVDTNPALPGVQPIDRVMVITHSLGGPVSRLAYLQRPDLTDQVVSFGGAFGGVGKTLKIAEMGDDWGIGMNSGFFNILEHAGWGISLAPWRAQRLSRNWPTAYDQTFNSPTWFDDDGDTVRGYRVDRTVIDLPGDHVDTFGELLTHQRSKNTALADAAAAFWQPPGQPGGVALDNFLAGTGTVFHYRVIGQGAPAPTQIGAHRTNEPALNCNPLDPIAVAADCLPTNPPRWVTPLEADGDNTVPYKTAVGRVNALDDRVFVLPGAAMPVPTGSTTPLACAQANGAMTGSPADACKLTHLNLPNYGVSLTLLNDILGGRASRHSDLAALGLPFGRQPNADPLTGPVLEDLSKLTMATRVAPARANAGGDLDVVVRGMVRVRVRDSAGHVLGAAPRDRNGARPVLTDIPGATYRPATVLGIAGTGNARLTLPGGRGGYDVELIAPAATTAELIVRGPAAGSALPPTNLTAGQTVRLHVSAAGRVTGSTGHKVPIDRLDATGAADRRPPKSIAVIADGRLTVRVSDDGAGVRDVWLLVDGRRVPYTAPTTVAPGRKVTVYATDRAGNIETPHPPSHRNP
ncbi:PQQ-binding-like beta-propeller repeat protein [Actinoplanes sp. NPDC024001]|uniref:outer membrane protein assembly factor BamB family protein n=1 Tax=Actinoplanes sp. NPDC024001 TaxID=3154598 RepID=UPI0033C5911D